MPPQTPLHSTAARAHCFAGCGLLLVICSHLLFYMLLKFCDFLEAQSKAHSTKQGKHEKLTPLGAIQERSQVIPSSPAEGPQDR